MPGHLRPFVVTVPDEAIADLHARLDRTRWPHAELVDDASQGVRLAALRALTDHWRHRYDWRRCEAALNRYPQFLTEIDGVDIHFLHVRSRHDDALPMILTHGWPGSIIEFLKVIGPLTDPEAHGGDSADAFHLEHPHVERNR